MGSETIFSPAKEPIEIVDDADWLATTGATKSALHAWNIGKRPILGALWTHGAFRDTSGQASGKLHEVARVFGYDSQPSSISSLMREPVMTPAVEREMNGKRTYSMRLVALPRLWYGKLVAEFPLSPSANGHKAPPEAASEPVEPLESTADANALAEQASELESTADANALAEQASELERPTAADREEAQAAEIRSGLADESEPDLPDTAWNLPPNAVRIPTLVAAAHHLMVLAIQKDAELERMAMDYNDGMHKLRQRLDENEKLRRQKRELEEAQVSLTHERDALLKRAKLAEHNLSIAQTADVQRYINEQVQAELARIMESRPNYRALKGDPE